MDKSIPHAPCATCPWLRRNHGAQNPTGYDPKALNAKALKHEYHDWYSLKNAVRIWEAIRRGGPQLCHATDPKAPDYGGKAGKDGTQRMCIGQLILLKRHFDLLEKASSFGDYLARAGRLPLTKKGGAAWAERILLKAFDPTMPDTMMDADVALPWESPVNQPIK